MGKPRVLVVTTAFHHKHRYRLHNFLPYLARYLDLDIVDVPMLSYDMRPSEGLLKLLTRVTKEAIVKPYKEEKVGNTLIITVRSLAPSDFGCLASLPVLAVLARKLGRTKYDALLATPFLAGFLALAMRKFLDSRIPLIYEDVDRFFDFFKNPASKEIAKAFEYFSIMHSDYVVAVSPYLYYEDLVLRRGKDVWMIPNGIEYARFREAAARVNSRDRFSLVYVGAVEHWSGLDIALKALALATRKVPQLRLHIIGEHRTDFGVELQRLVKKLGLSGNVVFWGRKPYGFVISFLARCRIGVLTFPRMIVTEKAFPYKVLEYCAAGTPVLMTNVTVLAPLVRRYGAGRVHELDDVEGLSESIVDLVSDDFAWKEHSERAIHLASLFDVSKLAYLEAQVVLRATR